MNVPPFHWWRTVFYLIPAISVYTIVLGTLSIGSSLVGGRGGFAHWCARMWSRLILATTGVRVTVRGLAHVPTTGAALYVSNHQSIYDIPILFWNLPVDLRIIAKQSLGWFPFLGWHLGRTGHVLVDRRKPGADVFRQVSALMKVGVSLLVFPEGTRSADGRVGKFKGGIFLLAIESGLPVVPVAVRKSRFVMRKGRLMTCPGDVGVEVFEPIPTAGLTREDAKALSTRVQAIVTAGVGDDVDAPGDVTAARGARA
ncbi:MAG: lysophospholipid acyltransferase family protein [Vicinamibacterales bacterium]